MCIKLKNKHSNTNSQENIFIDIEGYIIPKNNIDIKECAFENCESLISLYIPDSESFIDERICLNSHNVLIYTERDLKNKNENIIKLDSETYNKITNSVINQIKNMM